MKLTTKKKILDIALMAVFLLLFITPRINIHVHIILGVLMITMIIIHLYMNRTWIINSFKKIKKGKFKLNSMVVMAVVLGVVFVVVNVSGFFAIDTMGVHVSPAAARMHPLLSSQLMFSDAIDIQHVNPVSTMMNFHGRPSTAKIVHVLSSRIMFVLLIIHVKMHWKYLTKSSKNASAKSKLMRDELAVQTSAK